MDMQESIKQVLQRHESFVPKGGEWESNKSEISTI